MNQHVRLNDTALALRRREAAAWMLGQLRERFPQAAKITICVDDELMSGYIIHSLT